MGREMGMDREMGMGDAGHGPVPHTGKSQGSPAGLGGVGLGLGEWG